MNKEQFLAAVAAEIKTVEIKALNMAVRIRVLTGKARDEFHRLVEAGDKTASHFEAALLAATVVNEDGTPMFSSEDVTALQESNAVAVSAVAVEAMAVNRIGAAAEADAAKN